MDGTPQVSFLIAFRETGDGQRSRLLRYVTDDLAAFPNSEVIAASDDGVDPFHKTLAMNRAAAKAQGDVFGIWDADTLVPHDQIAAALDALRHWARPWHMKLKLNAAATDHVLANGHADFDHQSHGKPESRTPFRHAPPLLVTRQAFYAVGGMDERFRGWGQEDTAFSLSLERLYGPQQRVGGLALHLWHPRIGQSGRDLWPGQDDRKANIDLQRRYQQANTEQRMRALIAERVSH